MFWPYFGCAEGNLKNNLNCRVRTMPLCEANVEVIALINRDIESRKLSVRVTKASPPPSMTALWIATLPGDGVLSDTQNRARGKEAVGISSHTKCYRELPLSFSLDKVLSNPSVTGMKRSSR